MKFKNQLMMGLGALKGNLLRKRIPLNVMYSITNRCLSHCTYCDIPTRQQVELTTEQSKNLIDQIVDAGAQRIGIWGGEPLVREDIGEIIDYSKEKGLFVSLDTNGYLVPKMLDKIKNVDILVISFDGPEKAHDANREPGSYRKCMEAIKAATKEMSVWTITVLTKNNLDSIDFILDNAHKYGYFATFQLLHHNQKMAGDTTGLKPSHEEYRKAIEKILSEKKKGAPIVSSLPYLNHLLRWEDLTVPQLFGENRRNIVKCWAGLLYCNVDVDGSVYPCSIVIDEMESKNFLDVGFKEAFMSATQEKCRACTASCYTEYNYMFSFHPMVVWNWVDFMRKSRKVNPISSSE